MKIDRHSGSVTPAKYIHTRLSLSGGSFGTVCTSFRVQNMAEVSLYDSAICRLCAEDNGNGELLYANEGDEQDLSSMVNRYLPIKVTETIRYSVTIRPQLDLSTDNPNMEATLIFVARTGTNLLHESRYLHEFSRFRQRGRKISNLFIGILRIILYDRSQVFGERSHVSDLTVQL